MAKRRLNTKLIGIIASATLGVIGLSAGGVYLKRRFFKERPDKYLAIGKAALSAGDFEKARDNLNRAASLSPPDPTLDVMIGDSLNSLTYKEPEYVSAARQMWESAVGIDATNVPALERLVKFWQDELDLGAKTNERATTADNLAKAAEKLLEVDPKSLIGRRAAAQATIETMLDGRATPPSKLNDAEESLLKIESETPSDASAPYWIARSRLHQALDAGRSDDATGAESDIHLAESIMADAVRQQPNNASMAYHDGQIQLQTASIDQVLGKPKSETLRLIQSAADEVNRALRLVQPDDPEYVEINLYAARLALDQPDPAAAGAAQETVPANGAQSDAGQTNGNKSADAAVPAIPNNPLTDSLNESASARRKTPERVKVAEAIYRAVLAHRPNESFTRLALAQLLGDLPGHRKDAIALLSAPFVEDHPVSGIKGTIYTLLQSQADVRLLGLELDEADATRDKTAHDALIAQATTLSDHILGKAPDSPAALGLKGRLELAQNRIVEATQSLRRALGMIEANNTSLTRTRYELMFYLARSYEVAQQTGEAKKLAADVAALYPKFIPAQLMLARLMIAEHDFEGAQKPLAALTEELPDNPQLVVTVRRMQLSCIDPVKNPDQFRSIFNQLPETSIDERLDKARIAHVGKLDDEAIRLLTSVCEKSPGDVPAVQLLASIYASRNQIDQVRQLVDGAVASKPSDPTLVTMKMRLDGKSQDAIDAEMQRLGAAAPDQLSAFNQEMSQVAAARNRGDGAAVDRHLAMAQKIKPDDPHLWDAMFSRQLDLGAWDKAQVYLEKLAANDVDRAGGMMYRIRMATVQNDLNKAQELAVKLTRDKPEFSQSWCILGDVQRAAGRYDDAVTSYKFAQEKQVQNIDALRGLVLCDYALGKTDAAKIAILEGLKVDPQNVEFKEFELNHELIYGDPQKVIAPREAAVKATPDDPRAYLNLAATYVAAAEARDVAKDPAASAQYSASAEQILRDGLAKFPDDQRFPLAFAKVALNANDFASAEQMMLSYAARPSIKGLPQVAILLSDFYTHAGMPDQAISVLQAYLDKPATPPNVSADVNVELRLSSLLTRAGNIDGALAALSTNATDPVIVHQKIALLINANRLAEADKALAIEAVHGPLSPELQNLQGMTQLGEGKVVEARQTFNRLLTQQPDNVEALTHRAKMDMDASLPNKRAAIADLSHARDVAPEDVNVRLTLADIERHGDPAAAAKELENAIQKVPADKRLRLTLVDLYAAQKQWDDASRILHDASLIPSLANDADFIHADAVTAMGKGDYVKAQQLITDAMAKSPKNLAMIQTYYEILLHQKASSEVIAQSDELLASRKGDPSLWRIYTYRAKARLIDSPDKSIAAEELQHGIADADAIHNDAAVSELMREYAALIGTDQAIKVAKENAGQNSHWQLIVAGLYEQQDDPTDAAYWYEQALQHFDTLSSTDQTAVLTRAAVAYQKMSPPENGKAVDMYRRTLSINPGDVTTLNNLACLLAEPGAVNQPNEAVGYAQRAYEMMNQSGADEPLIKDTYGWTLIASGKPDEGVGLVQEALNKKDFPEGHYHLAEAMLRRTPPDPDAATNELMKALRMIDMGDSKDFDPSLRGRLQEELKKARLSSAGN